MTQFGQAATRRLQAHCHYEIAKGYKDGSLSTSRWSPPSKHWHPQQERGPLRTRGVALSRCANRALTFCDVTRKGFAGQDPGQDQ